MATTWKMKHLIFTLHSQASHLIRDLCFAMASFKHGLFLLATFLLLSSPSHCNDDEEDSVLKGINSYRQTQNLPVLNKVDKASCLADELAKDLEDEPCENVNQYYPNPSGSGGVDGTQRLPNLQKHRDKCGIDPNATTDGVILPVCVPKLIPTVVLSNYTHSDRYARFFNNSKYTGIGLGSENDWMVAILTSNSPSGSFASAASTSQLLNARNMGHLLVFYLLGLLVILIC